jgi:hypothetical protein
MIQPQLNPLQALNSFITRLQRSSKSYPVSYQGAEYHSATSLPDDLTAKLVNVVRHVLDCHADID